MSRLLVPAHADRADWLTARRQGIGASEIASVMGLSPWESPFSLWWRKREGWEVDANDEMRVGTHLEPAIADWFAETNLHENLVIEHAGLHAHDERPWQLATPDRLLFEPCMHCDGAGLLGGLDAGVAACSCLPMGAGALLSLLECKWTGSWDGWGSDGTDEIPVYYRCQVLWQMDVMGVTKAFICVLGPGGFRIYQIHRDERDLTAMREAGRRFMASLDAGTPPDIDSHTATLATLKRLHPDIEDIDIDVDVEFAEGYRRARQLARRAAKLVDRYDNRARDLLGNGRRLVCGGRLVVSRSVYDQSGDSAELAALDADWPTTDRLNPGRASSYVH